MDKDQQLIKKFEQKEEFEQKNYEGYVIKGFEGLKEYIKNMNGLKAVQEIDRDTIQESNSITIIEAKTDIIIYYPDHIEHIPLDLNEYEIEHIHKNKAFIIQSEPLKKIPDEVIAILIIDTKIIKNIKLKYYKRKVIKKLYLKN